MTEINTQNLKKEFHKELITLYKKITKLVKYKPTRLMDLINKYGGYEAAVKYITTENNVQDFAVLWESERLDLSVEALITSDVYRPIFSEDILAYCDHKLEKYSYAPNKIEEVEESTGYIDEEEDSNKINIEEFIRQKELMAPKVIKKDFKIYKYAVAITAEDWKRLLLDTKVVTTGNLDLLLRIYSIGDEVTPLELAKEKTYSSNYPYKEVTMALGKRIKSALKIEVPVGEDGKPLWWHLLFNGGFKDNAAFEWSLKKELREAITDLIESGQIEKVTVAVEKPLVEIEEESLIKPEPKESKSGKETDGLSAFDRLFASIMSDEAEPIKPKEEPTPKVPNLEPIPEVLLKTNEVKMQQPADEAANIKTSAINTLQSEAQTTLKSEEKPDVRTPQEIEADAKKACLNYYGAICDICGFDFGYTYGEAYEGMIEVHHLHAEGSDEITKETDPIKDLVPVCCNCHRVIHSQIPPISIDKMRKMVKA